MKSVGQKSLKFRIFIRFGSSPFILGLLFFLPAGSLAFWEAWVYMGMLLVPILFAVLYFLRKDPELLERRMKMKEKEKEQDLLVKLSSVFLIAGFLIPGFDFRYQWSNIPVFVVLLADALVLTGYAVFLFVMKANSFLSRTVEVEQEQRLITTGPYSLVRHPMYFGVLLMFLFAPVALGSWWALFPFIPMPVILILRIISEERVLQENLPGYGDYMKKVPFRMIPGLW